LDGSKIQIGNNSCHFYDKQHTTSSILAYPNKASARHFCGLNIFTSLGILGLPLSRRLQSQNSVVLRKFDVSAKCQDSQDIFHLPNEESLPDIVNSCGANTFPSRPGSLINK